MSSQGTIKRQRPIRVLVSKLGLDGHDRGAHEETTIHISILRAIKLIQLWFFSKVHCEVYHTA